MTTDQPTAPADTQHRHLRRRAGDRVIGGVAGGIADYLNIDALLIRAAFVGLMVFGGAGLVLYVGAWLLIPVEGRDHSIVDAALRRLGLSARDVTTVVLLAIGGLLVLSVPVGGPVGIDGSSTEIWIVLLLVLLGIVLLSRREAEVAPSPPPSADDSQLRPLRPFGLTPFRLVVAAFLLAVGFYVLRGIGDGGGLYLDAWTLIIGTVVVLGIVLLRQSGGEPKIAAGPAAPADRSSAVAGAMTEVAERPPAPRSPLAWYIVAVTLVAIGLLAIAGQVFALTAVPGQFFGLVLAVVGIGLVIGSWWGHAGVLILPAVLVLPLAGAATFVTAPLKGGTGDQSFAPVSASELREEYRLLAGRLTLDLRDLAPTDGPVELSASVALGQLVVILPPQARVEIDSEVGAGGSEILGTYQEGTNLADRYVRGSTGPGFVLDLETGIGQILVETPGGS
jgi:phage shock protein PspC (stress-responsive transcriptional regulator)